MSDIANYIEEIQTAVYGEEVRSAIVNALNQCYADALDGIAPSIEFTAIENGTRVSFLIGSNRTSFNVYNGMRPVFYNKQYSSSQMTCPANTAASSAVQIPVIYPTETVNGVDFTGCSCIAVVSAYSSGNIVPCYTTATTVADGANVGVWWSNDSSSSKANVTFNVNVLFVKFVAYESVATSVVLDTAYPVGSVYISTSNTNPSTTIGGGTWKIVNQQNIVYEDTTVNPNINEDHTYYWWLRTA